MPGSRAISDHDMKTATHPSETLEAGLGPDLSALIETVGVPVVEIAQVTTIRGNDGQRGTFRLTLAGGRVLKARRLRTAEDVERVTRLTALLEPEFFPPVLAHRGCGMLTDWVAGTSLRAGDWTGGHLRTCGRLQAAMHRLSVSSELASLRRSPVNSGRQRLEAALGEVVGHGALDLHDAREVVELADADAPVRRHSAICHRDLCGDNIVVTRAGQVCVIDNETIAVDSPEYDLARTWYRWPMTTSEQRAFAEGYGSHAHLTHFADNFLHWALIVLVESAAYRLRVGATTVGVPLKRLEDLLRTRGRNETFPRLLSRG
jgi:hypothetical protein